MKCNPLIFIPSVKNIQTVWDSWDKLLYDKFVSRGRREIPAYKAGVDYFKKHKQYTHFVICPDDLVIATDSFNILKRDIEEYGYNNICGVSNVDEDSPDYYCCKPYGLNPATKGRNFTNEDKQQLTDNIIQVGFTGYSCQFLDRDLTEKLSFTGACNNDEGCLDLRMALEMNKMEIPMLVDFDANFWHMRKHSRKQAYEWVRDTTHTPDEGYTITYKAGGVFSDNKTF